MNTFRNACERMQNDLNSLASLSDFSTISGEMLCLFTLGNTAKSAHMDIGSSKSCNASLNVGYLSKTKCESSYFGVLSLNRSNAT
jgi:hypothetical protein